MTMKQKSRRRANVTAAYERTSNPDNTTASQSALDRLPDPLRKRYLEDCRMWDAAYGQRRRP
jgi:hypothetical protein